MFHPPSVFEKVPESSSRVITFDILELLVVQLKDHLRVAVLIIITRNGSLIYLLGSHVIKINSAQVLPFATSRKLYAG